MIWSYLYGKVKVVFGNRYVQIAAIGLILLVLGYGAGRYTTPAKVVTQTKTETKIQEKVVYQDRVVVQKVYVQDQKKNQHTETTTEKKPDGTVLTKTTTDTNTDTDTHSDVNKTQEKIVYQDRVVEQKVETIKTVEAQPNWRIAAGGGYSIPFALGQGSVGVPGLSGAVIQAEVDRRIIGPVFLGLWGNTQGTLGLSLSAVW